MKTIRRALIDEIHYPISVGFVDNKLIERQLNGESEYTFEVSQSNAWKGALADCLYSLLQAVTLSESDKSIGTLTDEDKKRLLIRVKDLYNSIGEDPVLGQPMVYIGC
jgi:hypothetical protein